MPPFGFVLSRGMRRRVIACREPCEAIEPDPVFDHAFGLEAVLQLMQIDSLLLQ